MLQQLHAQTIFNYLYAAVDGNEVWRQANAKAGFDTEKILYGEVPFSSWLKIVDWAQPKKDGIFFDLGSGIGRVVFAAFLAHKFSKNIGIELLDGLHQQALKTKNEFDLKIAQQISKKLGAKKIDFYRQNIFETDLSEADFIFMNHPFKEGENFIRLEEKFLKELRPKTRIVTTIRALQNQGFTSLGKKEFQFSWGKTPAYLFEL